jgi:hypothetical protein
MMQSPIGRKSFEHARPCGFSTKTAAQNGREAVSRTADKDAGACAYYLAELQRDRDRARFKAAVDDFLMRHKDSGLSVATLRQILANAYLTAVPADSEGQQLIGGPKR